MLKESTESVLADLTRSYEMREDLWDYYSEVKRINSKLLDNFEMEYSLVLSEQLKFISNTVQAEDFKEECEDYIQRVEYSNNEKSHFIHKIELNILSTNE